ncbi:hypothetical protein E2562_023726 [Oryza meyeriana var. granulata]|uniref:Uncharacterized protein n=1 Tax=Oryza meyeriana var. granulata TaxID=110450 RepID=A0A6G1DME7_9ORYZ|nr:hypothetical protein E2562_023726 [Oryza meyeriana var. granulata]
MSSGGWDLECYGREEGVAQDAGLLKLQQGSTASRCRRPLLQTLPRSTPHYKRRLARHMRAQFSPAGAEST